MARPTSISDANSKKTGTEADGQKKSDSTGGTEQGPRAGVHPSPDPETGRWIWPDKSIREVCFEPEPEAAPDDHPLALSDVVPTFNPPRRARYAAAMQEMAPGQSPVVLGPSVDVEDVRNYLAANGRRYDGPIVLIRVKPHDSPGKPTCISSRKTTRATVAIPVVGQHESIPSANYSPVPDYERGEYSRDPTRFGE